MNKLESIVIVYNEHGNVATIKFTDPKFDRFISGVGKTAPYSQIEKYVKDTLNGK